MAARRQTNLNDLMAISDISHSIFHFMMDGPFEEDVNLLRTVSRTFDAAVRQTRRRLHIDTTDRPYVLRSYWPGVKDLYVSGSVYDNDKPFVFPAPERFATLFPSVTEVSTYMAAIDVTSMLTAVSALSNVKSFLMECDWGSDFPDQFRITTDVQVSALVSIVQNASLERLGLTNKALDVSNATPFMHALGMNTTITFLDLTRSSCTFADLAHVMRTNRSITHLVFDVPVDDEDAVQLVAAVLANNENTMLKSLSLLGSSVPIIMDAMCTNTTLEDITIGPFDDTYSFDHLTYNDLVAINNMLAVNSTLTSLTLEGNSNAHIVVENDDAIDMSALLTNKTLRTLSIRGLLDSECRTELVLDVCYYIGQNQSGVTSLHLECYSDELVDLTGNTTLTSLGLGMSTFVVSELGPIFASMASLTKLDLYQCHHIEQTQRDELVQYVPGCTIEFSPCMIPLRDAV